MKAKNIFIKQLLSRQMSVCTMIVSAIILAITASIAYTEAIRQITEAIWNGNKKLLVEAILFFGVIIILNFCSIIMKKISTFKIKKSMAVRIEDIVYNHYIQYEYWDQMAKETVLGTIWKIIPDSVELFVNLIVITVESVLVLVCGCIYGVRLNIVMLIIAVLTTELMVWASRRVNKKVPDLYREFGELKGKMYNLLWEQVKNREISLFLNPTRLLAGYEQESKDYLEVLLKIKKATNGAGLFSQFGSSILIVLVSLMGGVFVLGEKMDFSNLLAMIMLIRTIAAYSFGFPQLLQEWKKVKGYWRNLDKVLDCNTYNGDIGIKLKGEIYSINVRELSFCYPGQEKKALCHININFTNRMFYAIAGASGCGKSTLLQIVAKLLPGWSGEILINSVTLKKIERGNYWSNLTLTDQAPVIYPGTLLYNITLENTFDYDKAKLDMAIKDASLNDYIDCLPCGLQTPINENEVSKGEGLKINLARAFYNNVSVLLLDEITEGLDPDSEKVVLESLKRMADGGKMIICVSHKKELLEAAQQVIFMKEGTVVNIASHQYLIEHDTSYGELFRGGV